MLDFDAILPVIGEFGRYQRILFYLICIPASFPVFPAVYALMTSKAQAAYCALLEFIKQVFPQLNPRNIMSDFESSIQNAVEEAFPSARISGCFFHFSQAAFLAFNHLFLSAIPDHWCLVPELIKTNLSAEERRHVSIPFDSSTDRFSQCEMYNTNWSSLLQETTQWPPKVNISWTKSSCQDLWEYDTSFYSRTLVTEMNLVCDYRWWPTFCMAAFNAGSLVGTIVWGTVADRWGRRNAFFLLLFIAVVFASASSFATSYVMYTAFRILVGFTYPALFQVPFIIVVELTGPSQRTFVGIMTCLFVGIAEVTLAILAYLLRDWFELALATSFPFILLFAYWWILPESPRWLLSKDRVHEAEVIVQRAAKINQRHLPSNFLLKLQEKCPPGCQSQKTKGSIGDLVRTPNLRRKTLLVICTWTMNSIVYSGLSLLSTSLGIDDYLGFLIVGAVEIPACLFAWGLMDFVGRRWTIFTSMLFGGLACVACQFFSEDKKWIVFGLSMFGKLTISMAFCSLYVFAGELFPTVVRAQGIGVTTFVAGVAVVSSPYIVYLAIYSRSLPLLIMGTLCLIGSVSTLFLPETLHCHLPETIDEGEEFGKQMTIFSCPRKQKTSNTITYPEKLMENGSQMVRIAPSRKTIDDSSESETDSCF